MVLSLPLSWIVGLIWADYSEFCGSHEFARVSANPLRLLAFPQETMGPSVLYLVPLTTAGVHVHSCIILNPPQSALGTKDRTPGLIYDSLLFIPLSQNCDLPLLTRPQRQSSKGTHIDPRDHK